MQQKYMPFGHSQAGVMSSPLMNRDSVLDFQRVFIRRECATLYCHNKLLENDHYGGRGMLFSDSILLDSGTPMHLFNVGSVTTQRNIDKIIGPHVRLFGAATGSDFILVTIMSCYIEHNL